MPSMDLQRIIRRQPSHVRITISAVEKLASELEQMIKDWDEEYKGMMNPLKLPSLPPNTPPQKHLLDFLHNDNYN